MGFGWLIVGYFFVSVVSLYSPLSFAMLAGYPMMILALWKLAPYQRHFRTALRVSVFSLPFAVYYALYSFGMLGMGELPIFAEHIWTVVEWAYFAYTLALTVLILTAISALCRELYLLKLQGNAMRSILLIAFTYSADLIGRLPCVGSLQSMFALIALFMRLIIIFLNVYLFYGCYRYIAPEGEEWRKSLQKTKKEGGK